MTDDARAPSIGGRPLQRAVTGLVSRLRQVNARLESLFDAERDQLPLWLPIGFGLGIAAWFALPDPATWRLFMIGSLALALLCLAAAPATRWGRALSIFCFASVIGCALVWWRADHASGQTLAFSRVAEFTADVEAVQPLPARSATRLLVSPVADASLPERLRINVDEDKWDPAIVAGTRLRIRAWMMPPPPMAVPGAYDFARVAWFQKIGGSGKALDIRVVSPGHSSGWVDRLTVWRQSLSAHIRSRLSPGAGGIASALATGDQGAISEEDAEAMRQSGLAHLLSVSGLHLTAVVGLVMILTLRLLALSPTLALRWPLILIAAGAGASAGIAYTLLTGSEVPTVRSCLAALLILAGVALGREALTLRLVATAAIVVLILWPDSLAGPSFQLSFAAITAIVAVHEHPKVKAFVAKRDEGLVRRLLREAAALVLTGLVIEAALAPIALYHFHKSGIYGAFANVIAIPLTTFIVMPLELLALLADSMGLGGPFWWGTDVGLRFLLWMAHTVAAAPGSIASLPTMPVAAFALLVSGSIWIALWRTGWRWWGFAPFAAGAIWAVATSPPDLIVTGDGGHLALRTDDDSYAILRDRAGDYVKDMLSETSGSQQELGLVEDLPNARCNEDFCFADIIRQGRRWRILAARSNYLVPFRDLREACARADIVISERRLPPGCKPRWLKADRTFLHRSGGIAVKFGPLPKIDSVAERTGRHPWVQLRPPVRAAGEFQPVL